MLLFTFVENCFKHGSSNNSKNSYIYISLKAKNDSIKFYTEKNKSEMNSKKTKSGIGLINVQKRLDIIYPEKYSLKISDEKEVFKVFLEIKE